MRWRPGAATAEESMMSEQPYVLSSRDQHGVVTLTLNRPQQYNTIDHALVDALYQAAAALEADATVRAVVLRGDGATFSAGGDIKAMHAQLGDIRHFLGTLIDSFHRAILALRRLPVPVIGAVHGAAAGGAFSLAMACDLVIAARSARFVVAYPKLAVSADGGFTHWITRRLPPHKALELMLLGGELNAEAAFNLGLINEVVADDQLHAAAATMAERVAQLPAQAVREIKALLGTATDAGLMAQLDAERAAFLRCSETADFADRLNAFLAKRR
jgi:2-(1,2-epoxy-1,2-dihydrophenyl)acetyl-CoA isomerase